MYTIIKKWIPAILSILLICQSCTKDSNSLVHEAFNDKLLLAKVTGDFHDPYYWGLNNFMYNRNGDFLQTYSYGKNSGPFHIFKPVEDVGFINGGDWKFTYDGLLLKETVDQSTPGLDQGYWKYYYNKKGLIEKAGLAFSTILEPTEFEFYTYDENYNLTSLIYGKTIDNPYFKVTYNYDFYGNLLDFNYYIPTVNIIRSAEINLVGKLGLNSTSKNANKTTLSKIKISDGKLVRGERVNAKSSSINATFAENSYISYELLFTAKITTDNNTNPFSQQGRVLFYQTNRNYQFYLSDFYLALLKHNPLKVVCTFTPVFGAYVATQSFTYTYNKQGYPESLNEIMDDPDFVEQFSSFTQDKTFEYVK